MKKNLMLAGIVAGAAGLAFQLTGYARERGRMVEEARARAVELTASAAKGLDAEMSQLKGIVDKLSADLSAGRLSEAQVDARMKAALEAEPHVEAVQVCYVPGPDKVQRSIYWSRRTGTVRKLAREEIRDYLVPEAKWYHLPLAQGPTWLSPYWRRSTQTLAVVYSNRFMKGAVPGGAVIATMSLDSLRDLVLGLDLGPSGFGQLVSEKGVYLYHPQNDLVLAQKTIFDVADEDGDVRRRSYGERAAKGERGFAEHLSRNTGLPAWYVFEPVPSAGWSLHNTFVRDDVGLDLGVLRRHLMRALLCLALLALSLAGWWTGVEDGNRRGLWAVSWSAAATFGLGILVVWRLALVYDEHTRFDGVLLADRAALAREKARYIEECRVQHAEPPVFVDTGLMIESARFEGAEDVLVSGHVWQRYHDVLHKGLTKAFTIAGARDLRIDEAYRERHGGEEVIRWTFQAVVTQPMQFSEYPLDQETVSLRLRHKDLDHNVVLVPDLAAYKILAPTAKPGLAAEFELPGWHALRAYYDLAPNTDAGTTFGLRRGVNKRSFPALRYNVLVRRNLLDAFISNMSPVIIALLLLFALTMVTSGDEKLMAFMQTTSGRVVNICVSMFFVIIFSHIDARRRLAASELFYLEYFYFATYLMLLMVSMNSILFFRTKAVAVLQWEENLAPKLLFWPLVTGLLFAASLWTFY